MVLFEPPGRRPVLHTGDCRLVPAMQGEAALAAVRGQVDLILDTTYCSPEYAFPSQAEVCGWGPGLDSGMGCAGFGVLCGVGPRE